MILLIPALDRRQVIFNRNLLHMSLNITWRL